MINEIWNAHDSLLKWITVLSESLTTYENEIIKLLKSVYLAVSEADFNANGRFYALQTEHQTLFFVIIGVGILLTILLIIVLINQIRIKRMLRKLLAGAPAKEPKKEDEDLTE